MGDQAPLTVADVRRMVAVLEAKSVPSGKCTRCGKGFIPLRSNGRWETPAPWMTCEDCTKEIDRMFDEKGYAKVAETAARAGYEAQLAYVIAIGHGDGLQPSWTEAPELVRAEYMACVRDVLIDQASEYELIERIAQRHGVSEKVSDEHRRGWNLFVRVVLDVKAVLRFEV